MMSMIMCVREGYLGAGNKCGLEYEGYIGSSDEIEMPTRKRVELVRQKIRPTANTGFFLMNKQPSQVQDRQSNKPAGQFHYHAFYLYAQQRRSNGNSIMGSESFHQSSAMDYGSHWSTTLRQSGRMVVN